jgi:hypothetical protein
MSRFSGVVLVLAGLGVAAYAYPFTGGGGSVAAGPPEPLAQGAKQADASAVGKKDPEEAKGPVPAPREQQAAVKAGPAAAPAPQPPPWTGMIPPPSAALAVPPPRIPVSQPDLASGPPLDRVALAREIQRHLKRVGCYQGEVSGAWTPAVRRSMKAFTDRVNATLPVDEPDYILLAMVQSHQDRSCGPGCPAGESVAEDGRCLPKAIVARGTAKLPAPDAAASAKAAADDSGSESAPPHGMMALAGPRDIGLAEQDARKAAERQTVLMEQARRGAAARERRRPATSNRMPSWAASAFGRHY